MAELLLLEHRCVLDAMEANHLITRDTRRYWLELCPAVEGNAFFETRGGMAHAGFADLLEQGYINWRASMPPERVEASVAFVYGLEEAIKGLVTTGERILGRYGVPILRPASVAAIEGEIELSAVLARLRRACLRTASDLRGLSAADIREANESRIRRAMDREDSVLRTMHAAIDALLIDYPGNDTPGTPPAPVSQAKLLRARERRDRGIFRRSHAFALPFLGAERLRRFIQGEPIQFQGAHCIYEIKRPSVRSILTQGGDAHLSLKTEAGELLTRICLHTRRVPVLDHVAALALSILSGREEEILIPGNLYDLTDRGRMQTWLHPYMPAHKRIFVRPGSVDGMLPCLSEGFRTDPVLARRWGTLITERDRTALRRGLRRLILRGIGDPLPCFPQARGPILRLSTAAEEFQGLQGIDDDLDDPYEGVDFDAVAVAA